MKTQFFQAIIFVITLTVMSISQACQTSNNDGCTSKGQACICSNTGYPGICAPEGNCIPDYLFCHCG